MDQNLMLSLFGIKNDALLFSDTVLLFDNETEKSPFASIELRDGKLKIRVGEDLPTKGYKVVVS